MQSLFSFLILVQAFVTLYACDFEGCQNVDYGSCGNACCKLYIEVINESTEQVMRKLSDSLSAGGPDGRYIQMINAHGDFGFSDLRPYNISVDFLGQAWHTTANLVYNDTMNILLAPSADLPRNTKVTSFSISQIGGAYGDAGQNWFNSWQLFESIKWEEGYRMANADGSCPPPAPAPAAV